jgi:hypothetical protein
MTKKHTKQTQADWGGEFCGTQFITELGQRRTIVKEIISYHSKTNPVTGRANQTIMKIARTALIARKLEKSMGVMKLNE